MNTINFETTTYTSNVLDNHLESTIRYYLNLGWTVLKVEWERHDNPDPEVRKRWTAFFRREIK